MLNNTIEYDEYRFNERHDSIISAVRSFSAKLGGAINQGISAMILVISGIYSVSQKITDLEIQAGKGELASDMVLTKAGEYISQVDSYQTLILRIGMVAIPVVAMTFCYIIIKSKYKIDENEYNRMIQAIEEKRKVKL